MSTLDQAPVRPRTVAADLDGVRAALYPRSITILGASRSPDKRGSQILRALAEAGFEGAVYPVNPKADRIGGTRCYPTVEGLPEAPDLALIALPAPLVPDAVAACGRRGVKAAVVLAVGFAEASDEGAKLQERLIRAGREGGVRIVGPNTSGLLNLRLGLNLVGASDLTPGPVGLLSQSGNVALALMNEGARLPHAGLSVYVGVGNEADIGFDEYLEVLGGDEGTGVIAIYTEGLRSAGAFLCAAARVAREKPIVLLKGGRSSTGSAAALSHTGALAGEYDVLSAAFRQAGIIEVTRTDELLPVALTLANQPPAADGGIAILSDGGGQGALACDVLEEMGGTLAVLAPDTEARLRGLLGSAAATGNPVDVAGRADGDPGVFADALEVLSRDADVAVVLLVGLFGGYAIRFAEALEEAEVVAARRLVDIAAGARRPLVVHSIYAGAESPPLDLLREGGVAITPSLDIACRCAETLLRRRVLLTRGPPAVVEGGAPSPAWPRGRDRAPTGRSADLDEWEAREALSARGVAFPRGRLIRTLGELRELSWHGAPVAMKIVSRQIRHKTEAEGVLLDVSSLEDAERGWTRLMDSARRHLEHLGPEAAIEGVMVSEMMASPVAELLVGARWVHGLGCVLTLGAGGTWTETLHDVVHRVLPVPRAEVLVMLSELRVAPLLKGARGRPAADLEAAADTAHAVACYALDDPQVGEVEVNPLFVYAAGAVALDALVLPRI